MVHRLVAAVAATALVAGLLLVGWHQASVTHAVCVEHGGELHLSKVADHDHDQDDPASRVERSAWVLGDGDHDCSILAASRDAAVTADVPLAVVARQDGASAPPAPCTDTARIAVYRLAPKTSPPV